MPTAIVLLTRDLRVHDHPSLHAAAASAATVVPLFVLDEDIRDLGFANPNRAGFLAESLRDLDAALRRRGGALVVRRGEVATQVARLAEEVDAGEVHVASDVTRYARRREERVDRALGRRQLRRHDVHQVVAPDRLTPQDGDHYKVFSAYYRRWQQAAPRRVLAAPRSLPLPAGLEPGRLPTPDELCPGAVSTGSPARPAGGESAARHRAHRWFDAAGKADPELSELAGGHSGRLSADLHFGCLSATELAVTAAEQPGGAPALRRRLAWRDFFTQVAAARPDVRVADYRHRGDRWRADKPGQVQAWRDGRTGYPLVDAGMRQLRAEGWLPNRARLVAASFLTKHLYVDWRVGAEHFFDWLVDGDVVNNCLNWQWAAGTGTDTRPNRVLNPVLQARRHDPDGRYVRRWLPELGTADYPPPVVEHAAAMRSFRAARAGAAG